MYGSAENAEQVVALENSTNLHSTTYTSKAQLSQTSFSGIISNDASMQRIFKLIERVAKTDSTALILGDSGTGKELVANAIHSLSGRKGRLVPVNCGAIPEEILESELFGHERGSFTGAIASKIGRFQLADKGTIFLDEIAEMSPKLQVKLLRVLQEKVVDPVGSTKSIPVDVRVIAATNKDLKEEVAAGRFREDLFYRLQVIPFELPPLRARGSDVTLLAQNFLEKSCDRIGRESLAFTREALSALLAYEWPGNVRELENLVERVAIMTDGECVNVSDLPEYITGEEEVSSIRPNFTNVYELPDTGIDFNKLVADFESNLIGMALSRTNGNKKAAAELLCLNRTTLVEKIKKKGLNPNIGKKA